MHRSIEYRGRYSDSESPTGVDDPAELSIHKRKNRRITRDEIRFIEPEDLDTVEF